MSSTFLQWIRDSGFNELTNIISLIVSIVGFVVTILAVYKSKNAAVSAAEAARAARDEIRLFETIVDFSAAIAVLEEIKRLHRQGNAWHILPDRYAAIRKLLIQLRNSKFKMNDEQTAVVQNALVNLVDIEKRVEHSLLDPTALKPAKFNSLISRDVDGLLAVLMQLKTGSGDLP